MEALANTASKGLMLLYSTVDPPDSLDHLRGLKPVADLTCVQKVMAFQVVQQWIAMIDL